MEGRSKKTLALEQNSTSRMDEVRKFDNMMFCVFAFEYEIHI